MKTTFIATTYNEELTVELLLDSLLKQTILPDEIIIVDGGSSDNTMSNVKCQISNFKRKGVDLKVSVKTGNRAVGRNEAIRLATGDIILCSDAGCILKEDWVERMVEGFMGKSSTGSTSTTLLRVKLRKGKAGSTSVDVVAGYYEGKTKTIFQKCLIPYVLIMPDKVAPATFLPASRSMAFTKVIWEKAGRFDEKLSHNEDYAFSRKLKRLGARIVFQKDAIVYWIPRKSWKEVFFMFFRFAYGDAEAEIFRPKVALLIFRYIVFLFIIFLFNTSKSYLILNTLYFILLLYIIWAIAKNYKYVRDIRAIYYLPLLQLTADGAVMIGTVLALLKIKISNS